MTQVKIAEASDQQLRDFAQNALGIECRMNERRTTVLSKISQAWDKDYITVAEDPAEPVQAKPEAKARAKSPPPPSAARPRAARSGSSKNDPKVTLIINKQEGAGGDRAVFVGVNGVAMLIPRAKQVEIPYRYFLALRDAVKTTHEQQEGDEAEIVASDVPAYPFQVIKYPSDAEVARWNKEQGIDQEVAA